SDEIVLRPRVRILIEESHADLPVVDDRLSRVGRRRAETIDDDRFAVFHGSVDRVYRQAQWSWDGIMRTPRCWWTDRRSRWPRRTPSSVEVTVTGRKARGASRTGRRI